MVVAGQGCVWLQVDQFIASLMAGEDGLPDPDNKAWAPVYYDHTSIIYQ
jgi:hypothetical protein